MASINQLVNFKYGLKSDHDNIQTKDLNTIYFCTDTMQIFVGDDEYTKVTEKLTAAPTSGAAGTGTQGEHGKLYYYNNNLYLCEVTGGVIPTYTWTRVANINTANGTVTSITLTAGTGIYINSGAAITSSGSRTISHATPSGASAGSTSPNSAQTPEFGDTFDTPVITTDSMGHVTNKSTTTVKIPSISATTSGSGNVVTSVTASNGAITATKESTAVLTSGSQTVAGTKTFSSFPVTPSSNPTSDYQVANKKYVDDEISSNVPPSEDMIYFQKHCVNWGTPKIYYWSPADFQSPTSQGSAWSFDNSPEMIEISENLYAYPRLNYKNVMFWYEYYTTSDLLVPPIDMITAPVYVQSNIGYDGIWGDLADHQMKVYIQSGSSRSGPSCPNVSINDSSVPVYYLGYIGTGQG